MSVSTKRPSKRYMTELHDSHIQVFKRHIWNTLGDMRELVHKAEDKYGTAKFLYQLKQMGAYYERSNKNG